MEKSVHGKRVRYREVSAIKHVHYRDVFLFRELIVCAIERFHCITSCELIVKNIKCASCDLQNTLLDNKVRVANEKCEFKIRSTSCKGNSKKQVENQRCDLLTRSMSSR